MALPILRVGMDVRIISVVYVLAMIAVVVIVDVAFFRDRFWERLAANVSIVAAFAIFYFVFVRRA